nr:5-hydroxyisourate hydrolase precursor [Candidatus Pantoea persica]
MTANRSSDALAQNLKPRHVRMLSIAGVLGAGHAIAEAGPAVLLAYAAAGALVVLIMRMLAEMAVALPDSSSFSTYADRTLGRWAGFTIGWLYWWFWIFVIPLEADAAGTLLHGWFPQIAVWVCTIAALCRTALAPCWRPFSPLCFRLWARRLSPSRGGVARS